MWRRRNRTRSEADPVIETPMIARIEALLRNNEALVRQHLPLDPSTSPPAGAPAFHFPLDYGCVFDLDSGCIRPQTSIIDKEGAMREACKFHGGAD